MSAAFSARPACSVSFRACSSAAAASFSASRPPFQLGLPLLPGLLVEQFGQFPGVGQLRVDVLQLALSQAVEVVGHHFHSVHGVGLLQPVLPQRLAQLLHLGPQSFLAVADTLADLLLQLLCLGHLRRLLLQLGGLGGLLLRRARNSSRACGVARALPHPLPSRLSPSRRRLLPALLGGGLGLGGLALGSHLAALSQAHLHLRHPGQRLALFLAQPHQLLLHGPLFLVQHHVHDIPADDANLDLMAAPRLLAGRDVVEVVRIHLQDDAVAFLQGAPFA